MRDPVESRQHEEGQRCRRENAADDDGGKGAKITAADIRGDDGAAKEYVANAEAKTVRNTAPYAPGLISTWIPS